MTGSEGPNFGGLICLNCGALLPLMDNAEFWAAWATQPEGFYCDDCTVRLAAAPSFEAWLDSEWERAAQPRS